MSHLLTIAAAVWTILVFATPHLGPRQLSLNMLNIHELSDRRRTRGGWGSSSIVVVVVVVAVAVAVVVAAVVVVAAAAVYST